MRIALIAEGGYPYARGESVVRCDRLVRGLDGHTFDVHVLSRNERRNVGTRRCLPAHVHRVRTVPRWDPATHRAADGGRVGHGRRERRRFATHYAELVGALCAAGPANLPASAAAESATAEADRFANGFRGLAEMAPECGGLPTARRSEPAVRLLEAACRTPGALSGYGRGRSWIARLRRHLAHRHLGPPPGRGVVTPLRSSPCARSTRPRNTYKEHSR